MAALFVTAASAFAAAPALAQDSARDYVEPRITRAQFTAFTRQLSLDSTQRSIVETLFNDYNATLDGLTHDLEAQANQAGLKSVQDALAGKARLTADELRAKRVAVLKVYQQAGPTVDNAMTDLLNSVESILTGEQTPQFDPAARELRRDVLLHPRQAERDDQAYAGDGVDVLSLAEAATAAGGELQPLGTAPIQDILAGYEQQLDVLLQQTASAYRNGKLLRKIASIEKDAAAIRELDQAALERWKRLFQLNKNAVEQIGEIAATQLGDSARQRWMDRFDQASFTWLYPRRVPDRQIEWMRQQQLGPGVQEKADALYDEYVARRRELSRQAIDIMLRGRLELQTMLYSMMDPASINTSAGKPLYDELLKNSGAQATLESSTAGALEMLLTPSQRDEMRKAMRGPDPGARKR